MIVVKYKFNNTLYDLYPEFNSGYEYTHSEVVDGNITTRTIESNTLPTLMRFGDPSGTAGNKQLSLLSVIEINTTEIVTANSMFTACSNLTDIQFSYKATKVTSMTNMFWRCSSLVNLDLSSFYTNNVTSIQGIISDCTLLKTFNARNFNLSKNTRVLNAICNCSSLTSLDLRDFIFSAVPTSEDSTNFNTMLTNSTNLKLIRINDIGALSRLAPILPTRTADNPGTIVSKHSKSLSSDVLNTLAGKYWNVVSEDSLKLVAEYKFDSTVYPNNVPVFNDGYMGFIDDINKDDNGIVTRRIRGLELPTLMRFGQTWFNGESGSNNKSKSLLEILDMGTSNLTSTLDMFRYCRNLTSITCNWNTSNVTNMGNMFTDCSSLTLLDLSNFDTSNVVGMNYMFIDCSSLTSLDLSNFDTSKVTGMSYIFNDCTSLTSLDLSNFNTIGITNIDVMFNKTNNLTDIGMIHCDSNTINKIASTLGTSISRTIWVGEHINTSSLTSYDNITYKVYSKKKTLKLTSPLLEGDKIVKKEGKIYHYHKMGRVLLDGSEDEGWAIPNDSPNANGVNFVRSPNILQSGKGYRYILCDKLVAVSSSDVDRVDQSALTKIGQIVAHGYSEYSNNVYISTSITDLANFKTWLTELKPVLIYELNQPYYELISEDPDIDLPLLDDTNNTIVNNSAVPTNMNASNSSVSTIAMEPSTTYTVAFDKNNTNEVTINMNGTSKTTSNNMVEITTPSELSTDKLVMTGDSDISNIRIIKGSIDSEAMPDKEFEGVKSSFERRYIPNNDLIGTVTQRFIDNDNVYSRSIDTNTFEYGSKDSYSGNLFPSNIWRMQGLEEGKKYTLFFSCNVNAIFVINDQFTGRDNIQISKSSVSTSNKDIAYCLEFTYTGMANHNIYLRVINIFDQLARKMTISNIHIFEGDWTCLGNLKSEDFKHLGKYKTEYKITGKNKLDLSKMVDQTSKGLTFTLEGQSVKITGTSNATYATSYIMDISYMLIPNKTYKFNYYGGDPSSGIIGVLRYTDANGSFRYLGLNSSITWNSSYTKPVVYFQVNNANTVCNHTLTMQLEEGSVATDYEPYKEDTKVLYLNSPLLEGDTIEEIDGKTYHVKRMDSIVLDGSENYGNANEGDTTNGLTMFTTATNAKEKGNLECDNLQSILYTTNQGFPNVTNFISIGVNTIVLNVSRDYLSTADKDGLKQWLSEHPTTVVYQLKEPVYELISEEPLTMNGYANGNIMLTDNNIAPNSISFESFTKTIDMLKSGTLYRLFFRTDNVGAIITVKLGGALGTITTVAGENSLTITTPSELADKDLILACDSAAKIEDLILTEGNIAYKEWFDGMKSSFECNTIDATSKNLVTGILTSANQYGAFVTCDITKVKTNTEYTIFLKNDSSFNISTYANENIFNENSPNRTINLSSGEYRAWYCRTLSSLNIEDNRLIKAWNTYSSLNVDCIMLEGDWRHLTFEQAKNFVNYNATVMVRHCPIEFGKGGRL